MAISPRLEIRQSQGLVMTPQLMQAIKLLQLSTVDLVAYVEAELERNPLLERSEEGDGPSGDADEPPAAAERETGPRDLVTTTREGSVEQISETLDTDFGNVFDADEPRAAPAPSADGLESGWNTVRGDRRAGSGDEDLLELDASPPAPRCTITSPPSS